MLAHQVEKVIRLWISQQSQNSTIQDGDLFDDFGLDSLKFAELVAHLEDVFKSQFDFSEILNWEDVKTLSGLITFIVQNLNLK